MRKSMILGTGLFVAALLLAALAIGWGDSSDDATMKESISTMNELAALLESVKDENSAKEIEGKRKALKERGLALAKKIGAMPKERREALNKKYEVEGNAATARLRKAMKGG
jgi:hypothetical protein